jgi:ketosteroid isomerase-like protein
MPSVTNEELLRQGYAAFASGDLATVQSLFAEDIVWHSAGANQLTGDYAGHHEVLGYFGRLMELTGGTFRLEIHDVLANEMHGIVLVTVHGERNGQVVALREVNIWHLENGKAKEFWAFPEDSYQMDQFFG